MVALSYTDNRCSAVCSSSVNVRTFVGAVSVPNGDVWSMIVICPTDGFLLRVRSVASVVASAVAVVVP